MPSRLPPRGTVLLAAVLGAAALLRAEPSAEAPAPERSRQLAALGVPRWHAAGFAGQSVKVAVLDSGFRGYREQLGQALPRQTAVGSFRRDGDIEARDSPHGVLCAEVVHTIAPQAELLLANWEPDDPPSFLRAVRWAREQGASVLTCSVVMPGWSDGRGGGSVHAGLARLLGDGTHPGDVLGVASAGNVAQRHWSGPFRDGGRGLHEWKPGTVDNPLSPWGAQPISVEVTHPAAAGYRLHVLNATDRSETGERCPLPAEGVHGEAVRFLPEPGRRYLIRVEQVRGEAGDFRLVVLGGSVGFHAEKGSVVFPGDGAEMLAVGAVDADGRRLGYSCCGRVGCAKPECVATVPFAGVSRAVPFTGTSAAAPQAAGLAALVWSRHPDWTAARVHEALLKGCLDLGEPGPDCETGYGLLRLGPE